MILIGEDAAGVLYERPCQRPQEAAACIPDVARQSSLLSSVLFSCNTERLLMRLSKSTSGCFRRIASICLFCSTNILSAVVLMFFSEVMASKSQFPGLCSWLRAGLMESFRPFQSDNCTPIVPSV